MQIAESVDAGITFNIGYARGSPWVRENCGTVLQFFDIISSRVLNAHVYEYENNKGEHLVPGPDSRIIPVLDKLAEIGCHWWVLELYTYKETEETFKFVKKYLETRRIKYEKD
jgi:sugar phosphate isomerase/epimerase